MASSDACDFEDDYFEGTSFQNIVQLSSMNNKSSVLCPETQDITSQFMALQQVNAHHRMISRAKKVVDTTAPKSTQSFLSLSTEMKKKARRGLNNSSRVSSVSSLNTISRPGSSVLLQGSVSEVGTTPHPTDKAIQTRIPHVTFDAKTDDKITWYLEALRLGELNPRTATANTTATHSTRNRCTSKDFMDRHKACFKDSRPFQPRILKIPEGQSKVKEMECYKGPSKKKVGGSTNSTDSFESYHPDESEEDKSESVSAQSSEPSSVEDETDPRRISQANGFRKNSALHLTSNAQKRKSSSFYTLKHLGKTVFSTSDEERLNFLTQVTEDILSRGIYSDRAIQQAFEFHMQSCPQEHKADLQGLISQILNLKNSNGGSTLSRKNHPQFNFATPPEKETSEDVTIRETNFGREHCGIPEFAKTFPQPSEEELMHREDQDHDQSDHQSADEEGSDLDVS